MKLAVAVLPIIALLACSSPSKPAKAEPPVNQQQIIDRYTHDIWPATAAFNANHAQGSQPAHQFWTLVDPAVVDPNGQSPNDDFGTLRDAVWKLGRQGEYDTQDHTSHYNDGLHLGTVDVTASSATAATLNVCYTYTDFSYVTAPNTQQKPGASAITVQLTNINNTWYLHAITDDHLVPDCTAAGKT